MFDISLCMTGHKILLVNDISRLAYILSQLKFQIHDKMNEHDIQNGLTRRTQTRLKHKPR